MRVAAGERWAREPVPSTAAAAAALEPALQPGNDKPPTSTQGPARHQPQLGSASAVVGADRTPPSAAAEDAAYLGVLSLLRQGRTDDARSAARKYLADFPQGFRRVEMERVAR